MFIMESIKEAIRQQLKIEEVIGSYVTLTPFGLNFKACCPFHHEKTPSFQINTDKQMFYCFGCKKGGDIFTFIQEIEHVDFKESLKILGEKAGMSNNYSPELAREFTQKKNLFLIHEYANRFYQILLTNNEKVVTYLLDRGLTRETIKKWRIGYIPDGFSQLGNILKNKGFSQKDLIDSGLIVQGEKGTYDRFRGRIMFPITDNSGKVVGFSGRLMLGTKESERQGVGKYINSPETPLYHKSKILFGFSQAKQFLSEKKSVIIVEGQFDAILVSQSGYPNVIAISGTAGTEYHIEQLSRFVTEIIIATDSDQAGIQSAKKIAEIAYQFDQDVFVITLPKNSDPADIIQKDLELWNRLVVQKKDFIQFVIDSDAEEKSSKEKIATVHNYLFPVIIKNPNEMYRDMQLQKIAVSLKISLESIRLEFQKFTTQEIVIQKKEEPEIIQKKNKELYFLQLQELHSIYIRCKNAQTWFQNHEEVVQFIKENPQEKLENEDIEQIMLYDEFDTDTLQKKLDMLWIQIQQSTIDREVAQLRKSIRELSDEVATKKLQERLLYLRTKKEELNRSLFA